MKITGKNTPGHFKSKPYRNSRPTRAKGQAIHNRPHIILSMLEEFLDVLEYNVTRKFAVLSIAQNADELLITFGIILQ